MSLLPLLPATSSIVKPAFSAGAVQHDGRGIACIQLVGELDLAGVGCLAHHLDEAFAGDDVVVVDLRQLTFMDSAGLRTLADAQAQARVSGHRLILTRGPRQVDRLFEISGLRDHFRFTDQSAIQAASAAPATGVAA